MSKRRWTQADIDELAKRGKVSTKQEKSSRGDVQPEEMFETFGIVHSGDGCFIERCVPTKQRTRWIKRTWYFTGDGWSTKLVEAQRYSVSEMERGRTAALESLE